MPVITLFLPSGDWRNASIPIGSQAIKYGDFIGVFINFIIIALIGYLDTITGLYLEMGIFYLVPIFLSAWYLGPTAGRVMAC
jgi:hypothetical protein